MKESKKNEVIITHSDVVLLNIAHISIAPDNTITDHNNIWRAFHLGVDYAREKIIEKTLNADEVVRIYKILPVQHNK